MAELIDLNTARLRELRDVPGVSDVLARRLVLHRRICGPFRSLEDLTQVEGVSPELLPLLARSIRVDAPAGDFPTGKLAFEQAEGPIVFAGPPQALRGAAVLRNDGQAPLCVLDAGLEKSNLQSSNGAPLRRLSLNLYLLPGEKKRIMLTVRVDPNTSPGRYSGDLVFAGQRRQAVFLVTEHFSTVLSPPHITLPATGGKSEHRLIVFNRGNLPLTLGDPGALVLEDPEVQCRTIRETIRKAPEKPTWDQLVGTATDELKRNYTELEPLKVRLVNKPVRVEPGSQEQLTLEVQVGKTLPRRRNFVTRARFYDAVLSFTLMAALRPEDDIWHEEEPAPLVVVQN
jgi:hypothetical protein